MNLLSIIFVLLFSYSVFGQTQAVVAKTYTEIRTQPTKESDIIVIVPKDEKLNLLSRNETLGWYAVSVKRGTGWVNKTDINIIAVSSDTAGDTNLSVIGQIKGQNLRPIDKTATQPTLSPRQIAEKVSKSVVLIETQDADGQPLALGSGFFYSVPTSLQANNSASQLGANKTNLVATNLHVFKRAWQGYVKTLNNGAIYKIKQIVGIDVLRDLCVLEIQGVASLPLTLGNSDQIAVGDDIYAIGNPKGLEGSFSKGIISSIRQKQHLIQIDAAISPGSSGGAVVNNRGEVIGVAVSSLSSGQNLNFAIPANYLARLPLTWQASVNAIGALAVTDREEVGLAGNVRSLTIKESKFSPDENPLESTPQLISQSIFNEKGVQLKGTAYKTDGSVSLEILFEFDERGMRSGVIAFKPDRGRTKKTYTDQETLDLKLKVRRYSTTEEDEYDAEDGIKVKRAVTYDRNGNEIEDLRRVSDGRIIKIITKYDEEDKALGTLEYENGVLFMTSRYVYIFDSYGNWTKQTELASSPKDPKLQNIPMKSTYREITYY